MPFPTLGELSRVITQPSDPRVGLAAFQGGIDTLLAKQRMWQQQDQFDAELAAKQAEFETTEGRLWNQQAAQEGVAYAKLGETNRHNVAGEQQKRREAQSVAAKAVGEMLASGRHGDIEAMRPYLQSLGIMAEVAEDPPQLQAFANPGEDMTFGLGRRRLRLSADGMPLGEVDLDRIDAQHRAGAEGMLGTLVQGAPEMDRPAYETMTNAARQSPEMMAMPGPELFKSITGAAENAAGQLHTDQNALLNRQAASRVAGATQAHRESQDARADQRLEQSRRMAATTLARQEVNGLLQSNGVKDMIKQERQSKAAMSMLDSAIKSGQSIEGGVEGRMALLQVVTSFNGKNASNQEWNRLASTNLGSDIENWANRIKGGGAIDRDQLQSYRQVLAYIYQNLRQERSQIAEAARQNVWAHPTIGYMAPDLVEDLGQQAARQVLGAGVAPSPSVAPSALQTPGSQDGALEQEADQADGDDPEINDFLGGWNP